MVVSLDQTSNFENLVENYPAMVVVVNEFGEVMYGNRRAELALNVPAGQLIGKTLTPDLKQITIIRPDGSSYQAVPETMELTWNGIPARVGIITDRPVLTTRSDRKAKAAQEEAQLLREQLAEANQRLQDWAQQFHREQDRGDRLDGEKRVIEEELISARSDLQLATLRIGRAEETVEQLQRLYADSQQELETLKVRDIGQADLLTDTQQQLEELRSRAELAEEQYRQLSSDIELDLRKSSHEQLRRTEQMEGELAGASQRAREAEATLLELQQALAQKDQLLENQAQLLENQAQTARRLEHELEDLRSRATQHVESLKYQAQQSHQETTTEIERLREALGAAEAELEAARNDEVLNSLRGLNQTLEERVHQSEEQLRQVMSRAENAEHAYRQSQEQVSKLEGELARLSDTTETDELRQRLAETEKDLQKWETWADKVERETSENEARVQAWAEEANRKCQEAAERAARAEARVSELESGRQKTDEITALVSQLSERVRVSESEADELNQQLTAALERSRQLEQQLEETQADLGKAQGALAEAAEEEQTEAMLVQARQRILELERSLEEVRIKAGKDAERYRNSSANIRRLYEARAEMEEQLEAERRKTKTAEESLCEVEAQLSWTEEQLRRKTAVLEALERQ